MTAQQLRNSILQQAIQGRLVPQNPNDEPASVLLEKIRKQKEQLVKEGKLKKKDLVVTPIADDEKPFDLPGGWEWCRLKYLCSKFSTGPFGTMLHKEDYVLEGGIPLINPTNIKDAKVDSTNIKKVGQDKYCELAPYVLHTGDVVLARRGDLSKCAIITDHEDGWLAGTGAFFLHIEAVYLPYFSYIYKSPYVQGYLTSDSVGTTMDNLNQTLLGNLLFPLPPLAEQRRIVAKIEELMPLVEKYGKAQSELDNLNASLPSRLRQSILQEAIQGKLVPHDSTEGTGHDLLDKIKREKEELVKLGSLKKKDLLQLPITEEEKSFDIPENWAWAKVGNIFQTYSGGTPDKGHPEYYSSNDVKWAKVGDLGSLYLSDTEEYISAAGMENSSAKLYPEQTVLVAMYCNDAIGKSSVTKSVMASNQAICGLLPNANVLPEYLYYAIQYFRPSLIEKSAGGAQKNINQKIVNDILIPLPPLAEQRRIVAKIEELFAEIDKLK